MTQPPPRRKPSDTTTFLPMSREEMVRRGWREYDILLVSGDAYIDHPSFGVPLLGRVLESAGFRVAIVAQPRWDTLEDVARLGRPRLFCGIGSGCLDSMLSHYTAFRKKRHDDAFTPGGQAGARPNRATNVYANLVRAAFPGLFLAIGGIEASLRRAAHYDFWSSSLRRSILLDSKADLLIYGMGERPIVELAQRLQRGETATGIPGTAWLDTTPGEATLLPSYEEILQDKGRLLTATLAIEQQVHQGKPLLAQAHGNRYVMMAPPPPVMTTAEMDAIYDLPFTRRQHPSYHQSIPALETVRWSITCVRGCGGGCAFCSIAMHEGRHLTSRSVASLEREVRRLSAMPGWRGAISDVGGPTANLWGAACALPPGVCRRTSCLYPAPCPNLRLNQMGYIAMLRRLKSLPTVRNVGIASGIRYDAAMLEPAFIDALAAEFVSGHLKIAPEHINDRVLAEMRKPPFAVFEQFCRQFERCSRAHGKEQYTVPYIISALPGCTLRDMRDIAAWFRRHGWNPQQVQCFIPTPGTVATAMFYGEVDSHGRHQYVPTSDHDREEQHYQLFQGRRNLYDDPLLPRQNSSHRKYPPKRHP
ncbi:MAG: YgiQ family radical SAM protein [Victivallales bacterium]|nr:YgiQ family radical SAM protein [Victivallales bacterium]